MSFLDEIVSHPEVQVVKLQANRPATPEKDKAWVVARGSLHLFGQFDARSRRIPFLERRAGQVLLGFDQEQVLAVGSTGCEVAVLSWEALLKLAHGPALLEEWMVTTARALADPPRESINLVPGQEAVEVEPPQEVGSQSLVSLELSAGALTLDGAETPGRVVCAPLMRFQAIKATSLKVKEGLDLSDLASLGRSLTFYQAWLLDRLKQKGVSSRKSQSTRIQARQLSSQQALNEGLIRLATALPGGAPLEPPILEVADALYEAVKRIGDASGIVVKKTLIGQDEVTDPLTRMANASGFRVRPITLPPRWWKGDSGHLLGSRGGEPVSLIRLKPGRYELFDPHTGRTERVNAKVAGTLDRAAYVFYRPLPAGCTTFGGLVRFAWPEVRRDIGTIAVLCCLGAIMSMATPVGLGWLVDTVIPSGQVTELVALGLGLALAAIVSASASIGQAITALRIGSRVDADVQAAMTDRLLGLPAPFFRRYASGDLTNRLLGFQMLIQAATGSMLSAVLAAVMSSTNLFLMFYYNVWMALIGILMVTVLLSLFVVGAAIDLNLQRKLAQARGDLSSLVFQFITGISKLKVANAESRAFERWTSAFTLRTQVMYRSSLIQSNINSVMKVYNTASLIVFIGYLAHYDYKALPTSDFLALTAAYGTFVGSINSIAASLTSMLSTVPLAERFAPILAEEGEVVEDLPNPGLLRGGVEVSHVSFRYGPDEPLILKDVSIKAEPGEFVAVVGPSGSGKSTLFRMLLGFENPTQGAVFYDGQDLSGVNKQAVRRQLGVVLQNGQLMPGTVLSNIIGSSLLNIDDAWKAAEIAGLAEDIRAMPMNMHTVVSEGGGAFSGGQKQRLLIARAVVAQPRLLLLDEATSALDSKTQEEVSNQLNDLQATRLVIAHRLSTIEKADRIYVLKDGKVEQVGTYDELVVVPGPFQDLARRQML